MGLLAKQSENNILIQNGFKHKASSVTGYLRDCYEKCIDLNQYCAWVAVNVKTGNVYIYVEYDCGGEIATYTHNMDASWNNEDAFFEELDNFTTDKLQQYIN